MKAQAVTVAVKAETGHLIRFARIVAKHMTALADDLEALNGPDDSLAAAYGQGRDDEAAGDPIRCMTCGRVAGMPTAPCRQCPP